MSQNQRVYLVRHGETVSNDAGIVQGADDPLSATGLKQASVIAERIRHVPFAHLLASDMSRARVTAEHIASVTGKTVTLTPLLREVLPDQHMLGRPFTDFADSWWVPPKTLDEHRSPWGDSMQGLLNRAREALKVFAQQEGDVVAVTHGAFLTMIISAVIWEEPTVEAVWGIYRKFIRSNTGLTTISFGHGDGSWRILTWNDQAHLG